MMKLYDHDCLLWYAKLKYVWLVDKQEFQLDASQMAPVTGRALNASEPVREWVLIN